MSDPVPTMRQRWLPWHRRIGIVTAVFVLVIATTGLLLNHSDDLRLDERYVQHRWLLNWYGVETASMAQVFRVDQVWIVQQGDTLFANTQEVAHCANLRSVQRYGDEILLACDKQGWLVSAQGELLEPWPASKPLPVATENFRREPGEIPAPVRAAMASRAESVHSIHWERVLLDLHSGRLLGWAGVWIFDAAALLFIFLAVSGVLVWSARRKSS